MKSQRKIAEDELFSIRTIDELYQHLELHPDSTELLHDNDLARHIVITNQSSNTIFSKGVEALQQNNPDYFLAVLVRNLKIIILHLSLDRKKQLIQTYSSLNNKTVTPQKIPSAESPPSQDSAPSSTSPKRSESELSQRQQRNLVLAHQVI